MVDIAANDTVLFLHIPKTAGTALRTILAQRYRSEEMYAIYSPAAIEKCVNEEHALAPYRFVYGHVNYRLICSFLDRKPVTITMLRKPVDRLISMWAFVKMTSAQTAWNPKNAAHIKTLSLEEFVMAMKAGQIPTNSNVQTSIIGSNHKFTVETTSDAFYTKQKPTELDLERAKEYLQDFELVGLTERYEDSLALMAYEFGWWPIRTINHLNVTPKRPRLDQLDPNLYNEIVSLSNLDHKLYDYADTLFDQRYTTMCVDLLERYGSREQAHLALPLTKDVLLPLLERHYAARYPARTPQPYCQSIRLDQPIEGDGWQRIEYTAAGEAYRWSGPTPESQLIVPLEPGTAYHLSIRIVHALSLETLHSLSLTANDIPLSVTIATDSDSIVCCTTTIPADALSLERPFVRLAFRVEQTTQPQDDDRLLGLAFGTFTIEPVPDQLLASADRDEWFTPLCGVIRLDQPLKGKGWHGIEYTAAGEPYRWSGPERAAQLVLPLEPGPDYNLSVRVIHTLSLDTLHSLRITAHGRLLPLTITSEPDGASRCTTIIPAELVSTEQPAVRMTFFVDQTRQPIGDQRMLGLAFGTFTIAPIAAAAS